MDPVDVETWDFEPDHALRPEIELSWRRSRMSGLSPGAPDVRVEADAVDRRSRLMAAATPVLANLVEHLGDAPYLVMLADRDSRIVDIPTGPRTLRTRLDALGVVTGGVFLEENTGTNSIATTYEIRQGIAVHGEEHFLESFKIFSCYGHPIVHPLTGRLHGVLDITCLSEHDSPLLGPLIARTARDIEERLLAATRSAEKHMFAAFQVATSGRRGPVLVLGRRVVLANPSAAEMLDPVDHLRLRDLAAGLSLRPDSSPLSETVELASGQRVRVLARSIEPGPDGVLFEFAPTDGAAPSVSRQVADDGSSAVAQGNSAYVGGAPGTGRTTTARAMAGRHNVAELDAAAAVSGSAAWLAELDRVLAAEPAALVIENIELLPEPCVVRLRSVIERSSFGVVFTGTPFRELAGRAAALAAACPTHVELPELARRVDELPALVRAMLHELDPSDRLRFTPSALAALAACPWPGNFRELRAVVHAAARRRTAGDISVLDLPDRYQVSPRRRMMSPLERAEHDAIVVALRTSDGNKRRAAQQLGISRSTLYNRMKALQITG